MKSRASLKFVLTLTLAFGALAPLAEVFEITPNAVADSGTPTTSDLDRVPVTDRIPWLIYVVLTSSTVALAWILLSLARNSRQSRPADQVDDETRAND